MADRQNRYKKMEFTMACALGVDLLLFIIYMIGAGCAVVWLKAITAVLVCLISAAILAYLYITKELMKRRSLWISLAAAAIMLCTLLSLILGYPSPNPMKEAVQIAATLI